MMHKNLLKTFKIQANYLPNILPVHIRLQNTVVTVMCGSFVRRVCKTEKSEYYPRHVCPSVRPDETTRLPVDGIS